MRAFVVFAAGATLAVAAVAADAATPGFQYGVAAGEITPTSAVLWTRSASAGAVNLEVSRSRFFQPQLPLAAAEARVGSDWAVSMRVQNLRPATRYYYRFSRTGSVSPVGTFETALASTSTASVRFAISGDADATAGPNGKPGFNTFGVYARMTGESQRTLRATAYLRDFWFTRGYIAEGLMRLENALSADIAPTPARCSALVAASMAAMMAGDDALAREHADEAMSLADSLGDPYLSALASYQDACVLTEGARWSEALAILDDVVPLLRDLGAWDVAIAANRTRAWMYEELGDRDRALILYKENLKHSRVHGHKRIEARSRSLVAVPRK